MSSENLQADDESLASLAVDLREAFGPGAGWLKPGEEVGSGRSGSLWDKEPAEHHDEFRAGERLGDFELQDEIGRGGMGIVFRATQVSLNRVVALKILSGRSRGANRAVARFQRESRVAGRLHHTNIVPVYAQGEHSGVFYYAMELIEGQSLDLAMRSDSSATNLTLNSTSFASSLPQDASAPVTPPNDSVPGKRRVTDLPRRHEVYRRIAGLMAEVCDGLEHAHQAGIVHRDIKPQNLLLGLDNRLHVTDFGLAMGADEPQLTLDGELMGTLAYMSPEQIGAANDPVDYRTDIYSLGATLYEVLTLCKPFEGQTREQLLHRIAGTPPAPPRKLDRRIPIDLDVICLRALEKKPAYRYASAGDMAGDLRRFAENRPILTRRVGLIVRGLKWSRRHKAWTTAMISLLVVMGLSAAWMASAAAARRSEAAACLNRAYEQLVYRDYTHPEVAVADVQCAEKLRAEPVRLHLVKALVDLMLQKEGNALVHLQKALVHDPENREAQYMLAWAYTRKGDSQNAFLAYQRAEAAGGPTSAPEWFFRGLAIHRNDPAQAGESYRKARELAGTVHQFFPQATLHLARSYNQEMYRTRRVERVSETTHLLHGLIDYRIYTSYPYYFLSIVHRLAADIYVESDGPRSENANEHYRLALDWAAKGQTFPGAEAERSFTAEAECHESMGDFATAIEARTAAIALAPKDEAGYEGYGYRWRLYYWTGKYQEALQDLDPLRQWDSQSIFFSNVYPMLVHAEAGQMDEALALARSLTVGHPRDAQRLLWSATCLRILGHGQEADALLASPPAEIDYSAGLLSPQSEPWMRKLLAFAAGDTALDDLLAFAEQVANPRKLIGEAYFHAAAMKLAAGDRGGAKDDFEHAYRSFDSERRYTFHSKLFCVKMRKDLKWPGWLRFREEVR